MKIFYWFLGLFFLISIAASQSVEAGSPIPAGLTSAIEHVKKMERAGASNKDIATFVKNTVKNRLEFLNHLSKLKDSVKGDPELEKKLKRYDTFVETSLFSNDNFSVAVWAWENRMGQCNESAAMAFHILAMAYESTDEIKTLEVGGHRFVVLGDDIKNLPDGFSPDDLSKLDNTYFIDAWDDKSFTTKILSSFDYYQHGNGQTQPQKKYTRYKQEYDKWLTWCKKYPDKYQKWLNGTPDTAAQKAKDRKEMNRLLAQYRKDIDKLKALSQ